MLMSYGKIRKSWMDFRYGHGTYLAFTFSFTNFVLLFYRFLIEPNGDPIIERLWLFGIIFIIIYVPSAILIGFLHRKKQVKVDFDMKFMYNPVFAKSMRTMIDMKLGNITKEEINNMREFLTKIEKKGEQSNS